MLIRTNSRLYRFALLLPSWVVGVQAARVGNSTTTHATLHLLPHVVVVAK